MIKMPNVNFVRQLQIAAGFLPVFWVFATTCAFAELSQRETRVGHLSEVASIDCENVQLNPKSSSVARILCTDRDGAAADWDLNAVLWAIAGTDNETQQKEFDREQDRWRAWLNKNCLLSVAVTFSQDQRKCVITAFHRRAAFLRSHLSGDALNESQLTPEQHAEIQSFLKARGLMQTDVNGEFDSNTRQAIKDFQSGQGSAQSGFLSQTQLTYLRSNNKPLQDQIVSPTNAKPLADSPQGAQQATAPRTFAGRCRGFPENQQVGMLVAPQEEIERIVEGEGYVICKLIRGSTAATKILDSCSDGFPCDVEGNLRVHDSDVEIIDVRSAKSWESWKGTCYGKVSGVGDGEYSVGGIDVETSNGLKTRFGCNFFAVSISTKILAACPEGSICEVKGRFENRPEVMKIGKETTATAMLGYVDSVRMKEPPTEPSDSQSQTPSEASPDWSTPLGLCSAAIKDPLRPMIIDSLISGGKHIAPDWTRTIKDEIENDYGSFLTVHDDATVERVDEHTGKIGCAVTYQANIQGLAGKVLEEGATARAQILIRQMAQEGKVISRRLAYTVQKTSGGSLMTWFGLTAETPSLPQRRVGRCMVVLGGRCMVWDR